MAMNLAFFPSHLAKEREVVGLMTHPPLLLIINSKLKTTNKSTLYACECPKVSIVIYQRGEKGHMLLFNNSWKKTHDLPISHRIWT